MAEEKKSERDVIGTSKLDSLSSDYYSETNTEIDNDNEFEVSHDNDGIQFGRSNASSIRNDYVLPETDEKSNKKEAPSVEIIRNDIFYNKLIEHSSNHIWTLRSSNDGSLVARGILSDQEWGASVGNAFADGSFPDPIGEKAREIHTALKGVQPYVGTLFGEGKNDIAAGAEKGDYGEGLRSVYEGLSNYYTKGKEFIAGAMKKTTGELDGMLNGSFLSAFDMTKVFSGTDVTLALPRLDFTILHSKKCNVRATVKRILKYVMGDFETLANIWGIQSAPNGFIPNFNEFEKNEPGKNPGTFILNFAGKSIGCLLITGFSFQFSNMHAMESKKNSKGEYVQVDTGDPLYANISLEVTRSKYITRKYLEEIL